MSFALSQMTLWSDTTAAAQRINLKVRRCGLSRHWHLKKIIGSSSKILGVAELTFGAGFNLL
jgi:hypothetical protein